MFVPPLFVSRLHRAPFLSLLLPSSLCSFVVLPPVFFFFSDWVWIFSFFGFFLNLLSPFWTLWFLSLTHFVQWNEGWPCCVGAYLNSAVGKNKQTPVSLQKSGVSLRSYIDLNAICFLVRRHQYLDQVKGSESELLFLLLSKWLVGSSSSSLVFSGYLLWIFGLFNTKLQK